MIAFTILGYVVFIVFMYQLGYALGEWFDLSNQVSGICKLADEISAQAFDLVAVLHTKGIRA